MADSERAPAQEGDDEELNKRTKMYDRLQKMEATRRRAEEALRKKHQEIREKLAKERTKHRRIGGGFAVFMAR